jgi:hypothetical protein
MNLEYREYIDMKSLIISIDQIEVWRDILGKYVFLKEQITNPFRIDSHPNCWLDYGIVKSNFIVLNDFSNRQYHGWTIIDAIMHTKKLSFSDALLYLYETYILKKEKQLIQIDKSPQIERHKQSKYISFIPKTFTSIDKSFWEPIGISSKDLTEDGTLPVDKIRVQAKDKIMQIDPSIPAYALTFPSKHLKIYQPLADKKHKWISNVDIFDIGFIEKLPATGDVLFVCKSYKDARIQINLNLNLDYHVIWLQNEGCSIPETIASDLFERFNHIFFYFDNDSAGISNAKKLANHYDLDKVKPMWLPEDLTTYRYKDYFTGKNKVGIKDNAEFISVFGKKNLRETIHDTISNS